MRRSCLWMLVGVLAFASQTPARADDKDDLRQKALALNDVTGDDTINGEVKAMVSKPDETKKLLKTAVAMAKEKEQPFNFTAAYILGATADMLKDTESAKAFFWICAEEAVKLQSAEKLVKAYSGLISVIDLDFSDKKYEESSKLSQKLLEMMEKQGVSPAGRAEVVWRIVRGWARQGKAAEANKMVDNFVKGKDTDWYRLKVKGLLKLELNENEEARRIYEELVGRIEKDKSLTEDEREEYKEDFQYTLSGIFIELNKPDNAIEILRKLLAKNPNNSSYNNDLGYVLADNNRELDNAEKMIRLALEEDRKLKSKFPDLPPNLSRDSTAYLDSLGWVLFKKKDYKGAKKELLEATKDPVAGQHVEILDHLAETHMALGEKTEAIAVWKKALTQEVTTPRDKQRKVAIEKKLKDVK
jgi:tetratricopeptide (TPR) repeat protein